MVNPATGPSKSHWSGEGAFHGSRYFILLAVVVLTGIASYEYSDVMLVVNRKDGREKIMEVVAKQRHYFKEQQKYANELELLGYNQVEDQSVASNKGLYRVVIVNADANSFELAAEPQEDQNGDSKCATLTYNSKGNAKSAKGSGGTGCW